MGVRFLYARKPELTDYVRFAACSLAEWELYFMAAVHRGKKLPEEQKANSDLNFKMLSYTSICRSRFRYISSVSFNPDVKAYD